MLKEKELFFNLIKEKSTKNVSLVDLIADVLDISYDAAYRRIKNKSILSFKETIKLAKHFEISLDRLYNVNYNNFNVNKRSHKNTEEGFIDYFDNGINVLSKLSKIKNSDLLYTAKDIPIYYTLKDSLYSKFNTFLYLNVLTDISSDKELIKLKDFKPSIELVKKKEEFTNSFRNIPTVEIWNDTTINSKLYQIYYFFEIMVITKEEAIQLCDELMILMKQIENQSKLGLWNKKQNIEYEMYYNKIINLNNSIFLRSEKFKSLLIPYTTLSYLTLDDDQTGHEIEEYLKKTLQLSKKISGDAEVERSIFFTSMYQKIKKLKVQINIKHSISFL